MGDGHAGNELPTSHLEKTKTMSDISDQERILELKEQNLELRATILSKDQELLAKNEQIRQLQSQLESISSPPVPNMTFDKKTNAYFETDSDGNQKDGPFCCPCWEGKKERIRIFPISPGMEVLRCPTCKTHVGGTPTLPKAMPPKPPRQIFGR
jgi:hypothetical protein